MYKPNKQQAVLAEDDVGLAKESAGNLENIETGVTSLNTKTPADPAKESGKLADIDTSLSPATDFEGDKITVGTTAVEVTFTGTPKSIHIEADHDNSGSIYVGKSNVASDGSNAVMRLDAGEATGWDYDDTTNPVYVIGSAAGQVVYKLALL